MHADPCPAWGPRARLADATWEGPVVAQVTGIKLDSRTISDVVAALGGVGRPIAIDRARIERQMRELALEHVGGRIGDDACLDRLKDLRAALAASEEHADDGVSAERAVAWLRVLAETWTTADLPEVKAALLHAIYERITVAGRTYVSVPLTPVAYAHGLTGTGPLPGPSDRTPLIPPAYGLASPAVSEFIT